MIVFGVMMFGLMLALGGLSFDLMRYEAHRERLQATLDRAVLAAASLSQTLPPKQVVMDYFAKAGMADYIDPNDIIVTEELGSRKVEASAFIHVPLHHGNFATFTAPNGDGSNTLIAAATSTAMESIGEVEISMVLDVSGSMNSYNRLSNLKEASKGFLDSVYDNARPFTVSTSIVPYSTQVNASETLLSYFNRTNEHDISHCVNFKSSDFNSTSISTTQPLQQTLHFDAWTNENGSFDIGESLPNPVCRVEASRQILPWEVNKQTLKDYVDSFYAQGNTSTDIGAKWGAALLDPSLSTVLDGMIDSNHVHPSMGGRPFSYSASQALKVMIVMTDGAHTSQYYMGNYREGDSFIYRYRSGNTTYYSVWYDGTNSTPVTSIDPNQKYNFCDTWSGGSCQDWDFDFNPEFWFVAYAADGAGSNSYRWQSEPEGKENATRMTWDEVWAEIPPEYLSDEILWEMDSLSSSERNRYENAIDRHGRSTKDGRFGKICTAAKDEGVIIFTIGLEVTETNANHLRNCASSPGHYYDVDNLEMNSAFQSIAGAINQLRLTQ